MVKKMPKEIIIGKKELAHYSKGIQLTSEEAIIAMCYSCMGYYADGKEDCKIPSCPLSIHLCLTKKFPKINLRSQNWLKFTFNSSKDASTINYFSKEVSECQFKNLKGELP